MNVNDLPPTISNEEEEKLRRDIRAALGDKDHVAVSFDEDNGRFLISPRDYSLRMSTRFRQNFFSKFTDTPKWDSTAKAFSVPVAELHNIGEGVAAARSMASELEAVRSTWLEDIKHKLWQDIDDHERAGFNERVHAAMAYRTEHPEEISSLPPLPERYIHPVLKETYANTREGSFSNGPIIAVNDYFIVQYTSRGKLNPDRVSKEPDHWITLHSTEKFLHSSQDWRNPREAITRALGEWEQGEWKSIEYNERMKANVFAYDKNFHSPNSRKALVEQQSKVQQASVAQKSSPEPNVESAKERLKEVHAELKQQVKAKATRSRPKQQTQSQGMTM